MVDVQEQVRQQYLDAQEMATRSMNAWNELMVASTDMAFDVVLKNWNYSRSLRNSADQAVEDAIKTQHRLTNEMLQVWQGYTSNLQDIVTKSMK
ncbi:MAG: hypothetical protein ACLFVO_08540 [Chloroflexaceae bacterium]|jgi:hypothetical protein